LPLLILFSVQLSQTVEGGGFSNNITKPNSDQHNEPPKVEEIYSKYILILGTMTVIAAILVLFIEPKIQRKEAVKRASNTLKLVLHENRNDLLNKDGKFQIVHRGEQEIRYVNVYFDSDPYESVLHTGFFTHFCPQTQKALSTLHNTLEINNDLITYIDRFTDLYNIFHHHHDLSNNDFPYHERKAQYEKQIMDLQNEIPELIETVEKLIDEELKYNSILSRDYCYRIH
jgi:hypothetical protein